MSRQPSLKIDPSAQARISPSRPAPPNRGHLSGGNRPAAVAVATCTDFLERCPARIVPPADHDPKPKRFAGCAFGSSELLAGFEPAVVCGFRIRQPKQGHQPPAISPQQPAGLSTDMTGLAPRWTSLEVPATRHGMLPPMPRARYWARMSRRILGTRRCP